MPTTQNGVQDVTEITPAYRHSWDGSHFFYYHQQCVEQNPPTCGKALPVSVEAVDDSEFLQQKESEEAL